MNVRGNQYRVLSNEFIADLCDDWRVGGKEALSRCREQYPQVYVQVVARLAQIHRVEVGGPGEFASAMNREQLLDKVGERFGLKVREMFERFMTQLDREDDPEGAAPQRGRSGG